MQNVYTHTLANSSHFNTRYFKKSINDILMINCHGKRQNLYPLLKIEERISINYIGRVKNTHTSMTSIK